MLLIFFVLQLSAMLSALFFQVVMNKLPVPKGMAMLDVLVIAMHCRQIIPTVRRSGLHKTALFQLMQRLWIAEHRRLRMAAPIGIGLIGAERLTAQVGLRAQMISAMHLPIKCHGKKDPERFKNARNFSSTGSNFGNCNDFHGVCRKALSLLKAMQLPVFSIFKTYSPV